MKLSANFSLDQLCISRDHPDLLDSNFKQAQTPLYLGHAKILCDTVLEPLLAIFPAGYDIHSAFRGPALNAAVGGSPTSQHCQFLAVDLVPKGYAGRIPLAFAKIMAWGLEPQKPRFRQLLSEAGNIHIGCAMGNGNDGEVGAWDGKKQVWFKGGLS